jgi:hypothetical protein
MNEADDLICQEATCINYQEPGTQDTCSEGHFRSPNGPWRDGRVWVLAVKCSTCIFRPGNKMHLNAGRVDAMVQECLEQQSVIPCHQTLDGPRSTCRGFWDLYHQDIVPLVLAQAMDLVEYDEPPKEH